jgi:regulator of sigma E protease
MSLTITSLFTGKISLSALSGPVGIYEVVGESVSVGMSQVLYIIAFLSINVGFINILPFPAFDGGRVLFMIIEKIKRSPVNSNIENAFHTVGFILLMILMVYITIQDILKLV